jgi:hypothetical protein
MISHKKISEDLSKKLVGSIFSQQNISNFKYEMIKTESDLSKLIRQNFFTSINFCGTNSLLVFTKIAGKHYCFTVERQTLSYNFSKIDYDKVNIELRNVRLDIDIYNGTIFDGILVKQSKKDDLFIISDVYTFCGVNHIKNKLEEKLKMIIKYLEKHYDDNHIENNILLSVNKIYPIAKTEYVVNNVLPSIKTLKYRGLYFYPEITDTKLVYLFNKNINDNETLNENNNHNDKEEIKYKKKDNNSNEEKEEKEDKNKDKDKDEEEKLKYKYINNSNEDIFATLEVKSTSNPDVYKVNAIERVLVNNKKILKRVSMGIAFISGIENSHKMAKIFSKEKKVLMKCKFIDNKSKWEPIEIDKNAMCPTLIDDIDLELMELSDEEY